MNVVERLERVSERRARLMRELEQLPPAAHEWRPDEGSWSLLEIVEHLVLAEQDVMVDLSNLSGLEPRPRSFANIARYWLVLAILRFKIPVPVPSEGMKPRGGRSMEELSELWAQQHQRVSEFMAGLRPGDERAAIFVHPVTGPMSIRDGVRMLEVHLSRHIGQAERTMRLWAKQGEGVAGGR